jgi:hypothetical protein
MIMAQRLCLMSISTNNNLRQVLAPPPNYLMCEICRGIKADIETESEKNTEHRRQEVREGDN